MRFGLTCLWLLSVLGLADARGARLPDRDIAGADRMTPALLQKLRRHRVEHGKLPSAMPLLIGWRASEPLYGARLQHQGVAFAAHPTARSGALQALRSATVTPAGLAALASDPDVRIIAHASPGWVRATLPTTQERDRGLHLSDIDVAQLRRNARGERSTGRGSTLCNIDDGVDVFHPMLFRADGGLYVWFDEDGDGMLTPGTDRIDIDRDGSSDGVLSLLESGTLEAASGRIGGTDDVFTVGRDYLFVDEDGNGVRDVGPPRYDDDTPAFGEPLFIADDVNGDGVLQRDERLVRLKSSKISALYRLGGDIYERGLNLTSASYSSGGSHGTSVSSLLVGGSLGRTSPLGVAPEADVIVIDRYWDPEAADASLMEAMGWAADRGAEVFVHPYGSHFAEFADGSSPWEMVLDGFSAEGFPQVVGTHNFAGSDGHAASKVSNAQPQLFELKTFRTSAAGRALLATFRWREAPLDALAITLFAADGTEISLEPGESEHGLWYASVTRSQSSRETCMVSLILMLRSAVDGEFTELGDHDFLVELTTTRSEDVHWQLQVSDETGYAFGTSVVGLATDVGTIASPATADTVISVGASRSAVEADRDLEDYSGRGPRIDGFRGIDVVAPSGLYAASFAGEAGAGAPLVERFVGTSAAAPLVAGVAALIRSAQPEETPSQIAKRLTESAAADSWTGAVPNDAWGFGHLSAYAAMFGEAAPANRPPVAHAVPVGPVTEGQVVILDASPTRDPEDSNAKLLFRWDLNYDGTWDSETLGVPTIDMHVDAPGRHVVKLEVEDPWGYSDQLLLAIDATMMSAEPSAEGASEGAGPPAAEPPASSACSSGRGRMPWVIAVMLAGWLFARRRFGST